MMRAALLVVIVAACGSAPPKVPLVEEWPGQAGDYEDTTDDWTRRTSLRGQYQEVLELAATFKSPPWRAAYAARTATYRMLDAAGTAALMAQAQAEMAGPYEVELLVTTWDRRENDLDRGKRSVWRVVLVDDGGAEIEPIEIVKDKRPAFTVRADFPALGDFATAYIARFPRTKALLGPGVKQLRLRLSGARGGIEVAWQSPL